jgi:hypothetical protein
MTSAAVQSPRGLDLLLQHCLALGRVERGRTNALDRLEEALGEHLARRLVDALAGDHRSSRGFVGG